MSKTLSELAYAVRTREDLIKFIGELHKDLNVNSAGWENQTLDQFLEAMKGWVEDMDGVVQNRGEPLPASAEWRLVARLLYAGKTYE
jgi:hypothetical protein